MTFHVVVVIAVLGSAHLRLRALMSDQTASEQGRLREA